MANTNNSERLEETMGNRLPQEDIDKAVKALISLASSSTEADKIVQDFNPDTLAGVDTLDLLVAKYDYVSRIFGVNKAARAACNRQGITEFERAATDYYSLLSVLILRKWG